jgi:hypothetical protein
MYGIADTARGLRAVLVEHAGAERIGLGTGERLTLPPAVDRERAGDLHQLYQHLLVSPERAVRVFSTWLTASSGGGNAAHSGVVDGDVADSDAPMTGDEMPDAVPQYAEDGCARRWPLLVLGLGMPVLVVLCIVGGLTTGHHQGFTLLVGIAVCVWVFTDARLVFLYWPTGIRIDGTGIRIGGVRRAERHCAGEPKPCAPGRKPPPPSSQCYQVFSVPWAGVRSLTVVTDRRESRRLRKRSLRGSTDGVRRARGGQLVGFRLGMLVPPFIRTALVIEVDPQSADSPEFRVVQALAVAPSQVGTRSSTWVVPTRHPDQLHTTVNQITSSPAWNARHW